MSCLLVATLANGSAVTAEVMLTALPAVREYIASLLYRKPVPMLNTRLVPR